MASIVDNRNHIILLPLSTTYTVSIPAGREQLGLTMTCVQGWPACKLGLVKSCLDAYMAKQCILQVDEFTYIRQLAPTGTVYVCTKYS